MFGGNGGEGKKAGMWVICVMMDSWSSGLFRFERGRGGSSLAVTSYNGISNYF